MTWTNKNGVFVFSSKTKAEEYIRNTRLEGAVPVWVTWRKLVVIAGGSHVNAIIDHPGTEELCAIVPLTMDI